MKLIKNIFTLILSLIYCFSIPLCGMEDELNQSTAFESGSLGVSKQKEMVSPQSSQSEDAFLKLISLSNDFIQQYAIGTIGLGSDTRIAIIDEMRKNIPNNIFNRDLLNRIVNIDFEKIDIDDIEKLKTRCIELHIKNNSSSICNLLKSFLDNFSSDQVWHKQLSEIQGRKGPLSDKGNIVAFISNSYKKDAIFLTQKLLAMTRHKKNKEFLNGALSQLKKREIDNKTKNEAKKTILGVCDKVLKQPQLNIPSEKGEEEARSTREQELIKELVNQRKAYKQLNGKPTIDWLNKQKQILEEYIFLLEKRTLTEKETINLGKYKEQLSKIENAIKKHELKREIHELIPPKDEITQLRKLKSVDDLKKYQLALQQLQEIKSTTDKATVLSDIQQRLTQLELKEKEISPDLYAELTKGFRELKINYPELDDNDRDKNFLNVYRMLNEYQANPQDVSLLDDAIEFWREHGLQGKIAFPDIEQGVFNKLGVTAPKKHIDDYKKPDGSYDIAKIKERINTYYYPYKDSGHQCLLISHFLKVIPTQRDFVKQDIENLLKAMRFKASLSQAFHFIEIPIRNILKDESAWTEEKTKACLILLEDHCAPKNWKGVQESPLYLEYILSPEQKNKIVELKKNYFLQPEIDASDTTQLINDLNYIYNNPPKPIEEFEEKPDILEVKSEQDPSIEYIGQPITQEEIKPAASPAHREGTKSQKQLAIWQPGILEQLEAKRSTLTEFSMQPPVEIPTSPKEPVTPMEKMAEQPKSEQLQISPEDTATKELLDKWIGISKSDKQTPFTFSQVFSERRKIQEYLNKNKIDPTEETQKAFQAMKVELISKTLPTQIESLIINRILDNKIDLQQASLSELDAYEKQISIVYLTSGGEGATEKENAKKALNMVNSKRRELMAGQLRAKLPLLSERAGLKSPEKEQYEFESSLFFALDTDADQLYFSNNVFSTDTKSFIFRIIDMGEKIEKITQQEGNQEYINNIASYVLALATHPFLSTDKPSKDISLMFADQSSFNFKFAQRTINFSSFKKACETIADQISGFPTVPARRKASNDFPAVPTRKEEIQSEDPTPYDVIEIPQAELNADEILTLMEKPAMVESKWPVTSLLAPSDIVPSTEAGQNIPPKSEPQTAVTPEEQPTGGWFTNFLARIRRGIASFFGYSYLDLSKKTRNTSNL